MHDWKQFVRRHLPPLALPGDREGEVVEELAQHLEATYREACEGGASHEEALAGLLPAGVSWASLARDLERAEGAGQTPATARRVARGGSPLDGLWQDLRYGVRSLMANPTFAVIALLTLGVGIGANTAVFSIADHVLLRPLPYDGADRIAIVRADVEGLESIASLSAVELLDLRERSTTLEEVAGIWSSTAALTGTDDPEQVRFSWATSNLFSMMGVKPILGRTFTDEEEAPNGPDVVILSGELWRRRYGADPDIVGRTIELNDRERLVVGVLPAGFRLLMGADTDVSSEVDLWAPQTYWLNRNLRWLRVLVKTAPGTTFAQAQEEIDVITDSLKREFPEYANHPDLAFHVVPLHQDLVRDVRPALLALVGAVGFVLLIVCTNLANLLVARTRTRRKELVVRAVLGAGRMRVLRQILTESLLLALAGGALGLGLAHAALTALPALAPSDLPRLQDITLDARVALFAFGISLASLLLFGLVPALHGTSFRLNDTLKESGRSGGRRMSAALRGGLVVAELSISFVLLIGAALMVQTFVNLANEDLGFDPDDVVTMRMHLANGAYPTPESRWQFQRALHERIESLPGVQSSAAVSLLPLGGGLFTSPYAYDAESERDFGALSADYRSITPGYFEAMRGELVAGRLFDVADSASGRRAVIVDDSLARQAWPSENPIGQRVKVDLAAGVPESNPEWMDVVGVVKHLRHAGVREDGRPQIYFPYWLRPVHGMNLVVRASGNPDLLAQAVREEVKELGSRRPVHRSRSLESYVAQAMARSRFTVSVMVAFAAIALVLAVMGIYGVIAATVSQRTHELGVRIALGANVRDIVRLVLSQAGTFITLGALLGLAGALALARFLENLVFGVATTDPVTFAVAGFVIVTASLLACARPAWRGSKVEPVIALRHD